MNDTRHLLPGNRGGQRDDPQRWTSYGIPTWSTTTRSGDKASYINYTNYAVSAVLAGRLVWLIVRRLRRAGERPGQA